MLKAYIHPILLAIFCLGLATNTLANSTKPELPQNYRLVGEAQLKVLWFKVYKAYLYADAQPNNEPNGLHRNLYLTLQYQRDIEKQDLLDETANQWQKQSFDKNKISKWIVELDNSWPNVKQGDQISFFIDQNGLGHFYFNKAYYALFSDSQGCQAFINIWLGANSQYPQQRDQLLGLDHD
ncbi:hypothetical protein C2869_12715 [Saccharobesus litoralis]|uniref:Chalcone isomerase domain-containing protein n=1 Tax=Saccharobesus litoralis TaxID=2172099 RepID=A0A2S0VSQ7_9ALTE|nr:chalcone isomerase family protein [Saccharobesus litoralis]AWB67248.1 hypothetical protein C2869_12715 [Saccharobesus litoralis]